MFEKVKKILVDSLNIDENIIKPESKLSEDLGIDSLSAVELSLELENSFNVQLSDEELQNLKTVQDICNVLSKKVEQ